MKQVSVVEFGGTIAEKIVVNEDEIVMLVTTKAEWDAAQREARAPVTVGFRKEYLVAGSEKELTVH